MPFFPSSVATALQLLEARNNKSAILDVTINQFATTIDLDDSTVFPSAGYVTFTDNNEVVQYTGNAANQLTGCTRGADGTTASAHTAGATVEQRTNAAYHNELAGELIAVEQFLSDKIGIDPNELILTNDAVTVDLIKLRSQALSVLWAFELNDSTGLLRLHPNGGSRNLQIDATTARFADGAVSAPAITFTSDTDTGVYWIGTNQLGFATGATLALALNASQQVLVPKTSNQFILGTTNTVTLNAAAPSASRVYTMVDPGADASFIMSELAQTLNGIKTFSAGIPILATTNQLILGTTNTTTITAPAPAASRVYTIPDVLGSADFVMTAGAQTITGIKTMTGANLITLAAGSAASPSLYFTGDPNTGIYAPAADEFGISVGGVLNLHVLGAQVRLGSAASNGSAASPVIRFASQNTGFYTDASGFINISLGGTARFSLDSSSFIGVADNTYDLGATSLAWRNIFVKSGIRYLETGAGTEYTQLEGASAIGTSYRIALPAAAPTTVGQVMKVQSTGTPNILEWGTGGGSGGINYVANPDAEADTTGWTTYQDSSAIPTDGTGGTPNITWTRTTSSPLRGTGSFLFTKDGADRTGQGAAYAFTIDRADKNKVLSITADYEPDSNYVDQALTVYVYDVTNAQVIQPGGYIINKVNGQAKIIATFQTSDSTSYRLLIHVAGNTTTAFTVKFDNVIVGPQTVQYGAPITSWRQYTATTVNFTGTKETQYRRVGDSIEIEGKFINSANYGGVFAFTIPPGLTIDTAKLTVDGGFDPLGIGFFLGASLEYGGFAVYANDVGTNYIKFRGKDGAAFPGYWGLNSPTTTGSSDIIVVRCVVPVVGWESAVVMSNDTDTRVVAMNALNTSGQSIPNNTSTDITNWTTGSDTHGSFAPTTGIYTIAVPGWYRIDAMCRFNANSTGIRVLTLFKNGSTNLAEAINGNPSASNAAGINATTTVYLLAGDNVRANVYQNSGGALALQATSGYVTFSVNRVSGPSQIAASETVSARYQNGNSTAVPNNQFTYMDFPTKSWDSHGAALGAGGGFSTTYTNTWRYVAPIPGIYSVKFHANTGATGAVPAGTQITCQIDKNGTADSVMQLYYAPSMAGDRYVEWMGSGNVRCLAGDAISIKIFQNSGVTPGLIGTAVYNYVAIDKVGNYV